MTPHLCHWPSCATPVAPKFWGCREHWFRLPFALRDRIWATYVQGQESTKTPSVAYLEVMERVRDWIREKGGPP